MRSQRENDPLALTNWTICFKDSGRVGYRDGA